MIERLAHVIVDVLLPGDEDAQLPAASEVGVNDALVAVLRTPDGHAYHSVVSAVARQLGGAHEFLHTTPDRRIAVLQSVEKELPVEFRTFLVFALEAYYESEPVLRAMGWRPEPPQPLGHAVDPLDETLLDAVRTRGALWREVTSAREGAPQKQELRARGGARRRTRRR